MEIKNLQATVKKNKIHNLISCTPHENVKLSQILKWLYATPCPRPFAFSD
jgi:hypothetical protein